MCGRYTRKDMKHLQKAMNDYLAQFNLPPLDFDRPIVEPTFSNYNVAPTTLQPVITSDRPNLIQEFQWGLLPFWAKDRKLAYSTINARKESIIEKKPAFRGLITKNRCIIPVNGYYEWRPMGKIKQPFYFSHKERDLMFFAGLHTNWTDKETGENVNSFTIITTEPNELQAKIHDRMPVILRDDQITSWLFEDLTENAAIDMLQQYPAELMQVWPVSTRVNNTRNNGPELVERVELQETLL